jgi:arylsulfatase A-like enzyme
MAEFSPKKTKSSGGLDRRGFLERVGRVAGGVALSTIAPQLLKPQAATAQTFSPPNILVILVDQWRSPIWFPDQTTLAQLLPNTSALFSQSVNFTNYFTAATACSASRGTLVTGLYSHQTAVLITQHNDLAPNLNPGFPTFGTLLQQQDYETFWYGKWHLSDYDSDTPLLNVYGFAGGTYPSPNGSVGQGLEEDPNITQQFVQWLNAQSGAAPWCTTVSFINPHDVTQYYTGTNTVPGENDPPSVFTEMPGNFETTSQLKAKPKLQAEFQKHTEALYGTLPDRGAGYQTSWLELLDTYLYCEQLVDQQIGAVLNALASSPYANNTIVIFTADHGEYGGSHGLHDKGGAVYDESIHVPLYVRNLGNADAGATRTQLCSSVDFIALLMYLGTGSESWRNQYSYLANRAQMGEILQDPNTAGRDYILHTTDEAYAGETKSSRYDEKIPVHVVGYRTTAGKLGLYSYWDKGTIDIATSGHELEFYDYSTQDGIIELTSKPTSGLAKQYYKTLTSEVIPNELRQPLPSSLQTYQEQAIQAYLTYLTTLK